MNEELKIIISAEIKKLKDNVKKAKDTVKEFAEKSKEATSQAKEAFNGAADGIKSGLKVVGATVAGAATALLALANSTKEYRAAQAQLTTAFESAGGSATMAKNTYNDLYRVLGDSGKATEAATHLAKLTTNEKELSEWTNIAQGVYATFTDSLPIESLTEAANETAKIGTVTGSLADALNWAGVSEDDFNEKLAKCNDEAEREKLIRETLNGIYSDAAASYEKNNAQVLAQNEAQAKLDENLAKVGETLAPVITALTNLANDVFAILSPYLQEFSEKYLPIIQDALSKVGEYVGIVISWIVDNWETIKLVATIVGAIAAAILLVNAALNAYSVIMGIVNFVMSASPITWIILGITALIAVIIVCIAYWDEIKEAISKAWESIKAKTTEVVEKIKTKITEFKEKIAAVFEAIKSAIKEKLNAAKEIALSIFEGITNGIKNKIETAKNIIKNVIALIKGIFTGDFGAAKEALLNIFDSIVTGIKNKLENAKNTVKSVIDKIKDFFNFEWSLPKLKMPSVSITGKFSLNPLEVPKFSIKWNKLGGVFEKPTLFNYGGSLQGIGEDGAEAVVPLERNTQWLDRMATMINDKMGMRPVILMVDKKVLAETSVDGINDITRATGSLPLVIA